MAGLGPAPLAALMLARWAPGCCASNGRANRSFLGLSGDLDYARYGRSVITVDLKRPEGVELVLALIEKADVLIEGFRPGVMERLGLGPEAALQRQPKLIYGRVTGFGQEGPLAQRAGHDLTYLAYSGDTARHRPEGRQGPPCRLNVIGDYGGGTMFLHRRHSRGADWASNIWQGASRRRGDGRWRAGPGLAACSPIWPRGNGMTAGFEPARFRRAVLRHLRNRRWPVCRRGLPGTAVLREFARLLPLDDAFCARQYDQSCWPQMRAEIAARMKERSRDEWAALFEAMDACVAPVLSFEEARQHPHNVARAAHLEGKPFPRPAPAPRLSRSPLVTATRSSTEAPAEILEAFGIADADALVSGRIVGQNG